MRLCLERERWDRSGHAAFGVEHVKPKGTAEFEGLICDYGNLVYACNRCNSWKRDVILVDPCSAALAIHLRMDADGTMTGLTPDGERLISTLGLNDARPRQVRQRSMRVLRLYQVKPDDPDIRAMYLDFFSYPDEIPDLDSLRPESNSRQDGLAEAYFRQRTEGRLAETYF